MVLPTLVCASGVNAACGRNDAHSALCWGRRGVVSQHRHSGSSALITDQFVPRYGKLGEIIRCTRKGVRNIDKGAEAAPGFEPGNGGFADLCLTTWLCSRCTLAATTPPTVGQWRDTAFVRILALLHRGCDRTGQAKSLAYFSLSVEASVYKEEKCQRCQPGRCAPIFHFPSLPIIGLRRTGTA